MSINVQVSPIPNINILVGNSGNLLNLSPQGYTLHANTHISGGIDAIDHNYLFGLQGGQSNQYYHLTSGQYTNLNSIINSTGTYTLHSETGAFYASSNPSGFITGINNIVYDFGNQNISGIKNFYSRPTVNGTGILLSGDITAQPEVTGVSGYLQGQITVLNNQTGSYALKSETGNFITNGQTGQFYSSNNPNQYAPTGYVTGISGGLQYQITALNNKTGSYYLNTNPSGYITGVDLSFSGNYYTKNESESRYVNATGAETILGNKTFHDNVYINNLYVTGVETIINTTNTNVSSNYIMLNLTGGAVDGGIFFVTGSGLTGINDSGAIIGFDHSDKFKFGISTRASDLSTLDTIASFEEVTTISGGLQTQISTLNSQTGGYVLKTETGQFYASSNPSGFITGVDLSSYATQVYVTGISGDLQTQITSLSNSTGSYVLNTQTGQFYASSNPSGFITGINNLVYTTGDQSISGNINISGNLTISGVYNIYQQIENAKILAIAYAIAL